MLEIDRLQFRPGVDSLVNQFVEISGRSAGRGWFVDYVELLWGDIAQECGESSLGALLVVLRVQQKQLRLRKIDLGKTEIEIGFQRALRQGLYLVDHHLP